MRMLQGFSSRDLAVLINCNDGKAERCLVLCSVYFPYNSEGPPLTSDFEELVRFCREKPLSTNLVRTRFTPHVVG